jgi:uncharacterized protein DUF6931
MSRIRFATIRALSESCPEALKNIRAEPTDESPVAFINGLSASGKPDHAIEVCAYLLPRREAVWWGCASLRKLLGGELGDTTGLVAAEAWVQEPSEENRLTAFEVGTTAPDREPLTWLALAAGWSSGNFPETPFPFPPFMTSRGVRIALLIGMRRVTGEDRPMLLQSCLSEGIRLAETGGP